MDGVAVDSYVNARSAILRADVTGRATVFPSSSLLHIVRRWAGPILVCGIGFLLPAFADQFDFGYGPPSGSKSAGDEPWREAEVALPAYPADANLVRLPPQPTDTFKVFVDERSVTVGHDGVMRLTFVVESPSGVRNVFYDGIRCAKAEYKTYAIGTADKRMQAMASARWLTIGPIGPNNFRRYVYQTLVCRRVPMPSPEEFIRDLKGIKYQGFDRP
jgi:hypothetical protein